MTAAHLIDYIRIAPTFHSVLTLVPGCRRRRSRRGCRAWGQVSLHVLLAGWEVSLCVAIDKVGELALPEQGLLTDTAFLQSYGIVCGYDFVN